MLAGMRSIALGASVFVLLAGCGDDDGGTPSDERLIRGWVTAVSGSDYERAAAYFARGAVVEQVEEIRLPDRDAAEAFNRSLPCRANLTDVKDEGPTTLATFRLRAGPGGPCQGEVQVRFTIRDGKFTEWRQLPQDDQAPEGESV
jgi:hypothetical protein